MSVRVALFGHREWAHTIFTALVRDPTLKQLVTFLGVTTIAPDSRYADLGVSDFSNLQLPIHVIDPGVKGVLKEQLDMYKADLNLFYGWSWILPPEVTNNHTCVCLHPSYLPYYRGGSPIQNQILAGETQGGVTLFVMAQGIDDGDIVGQQHISLSGELADVFNNMAQAGITLSQTMLRDAAAGSFKPVPQDDSKATFCKRRAREDSEITAAELTTSTAQYIYNKIRALQDPYPNAYLRFGSTTVLLKRACVTTHSDVAHIIDAASLEKGELPAFLAVRNGNANEQFVLRLGSAEHVLVTQYALRSQT